MIGDTYGILEDDPEYNCKCLSFVLSGFNHDLKTRSISMTSF